MKSSFNRIIFWLLVLCLSNTASSQTFYDLFDSFEKSKGIEALQPQLDSLLKSTPDYLKYTEMSHDFSVKYFRLRDYNAAIKYAQLEVNSFEKHEVVDEKYSRALYQLGYFQDLTAQPDIALQNFSKVISIDPNSYISIQAYGKLGSCYYKLGDYYQAEIYYLKAISDLENYNDSGFLASQYLSLSKVYHTLDTEDSRTKELNILKKVLELNKKVKLNDRRLSILYNNLANYYNNEKSYDFYKAKLYYQKLLKHSIEKADSTSIGIGYGNLGNLYIKQGIDSAKYFLNRSLEYSLSIESKDRVFKNIANFELNNGNNESALTFLDKAIQVNFTNEQVDTNTPSLVHFKNAINPIGVINSLSKKAEILLHQYDNSKKNSYIINAFKNLQTADSLIDYIQNANNEESSKMYWRKEASKVYHYAVYCSYILDDAKLAFIYSEKNKAVLLTENIIQNSFDVPESIKNRRRFLSNKLIEYERKLEEKKDSNSIKFFNKAILNQRLEIKKYDDSIATNYTDGLTKTHTNQLTSLSEVQKKLTPNEMVISYVWNEEVICKNHLMCVVITPTDAQVFELEDADDLKLEISQYLQLLSKPFNTEDDIKEYSIKANSIYNRLFPEEIQKQIKAKKTTIIADGQLQNIPFDALITDIKKHTYLINESQINYAYSLSFSKSNAAINRTAKKNLISFSPTTFDLIGLPKLYNTNEEITSINKYIEGDNYINNNATKSNFKEYINDYKIIHLATHASSGENPFIAFHDSKLSIKELYSLENNAQLVFLSACDTSIGEIIQGEGTLTLARGFFYTGSQAVVASLWKTSDKSTSYIVEDFYKNIEENEGVSTALHNAKLKYLRENSLSDASPYYWASLKAMGDNQPISLDNYNIYYWIVAILILILLIFFFLKSRKG
ncbi:CHAT domain-containing protein [Nonlabens ulvanivorans]|uniref:CHAT domain-containing protein n=1 Tax=Nonlabens ulvanivorans TaxID=906888 RepID=UPI002942E637|nr:CHAT domain-containing protein [Nonlabens ulvanivorans]WOI21581.1 CHAT domain-containing protein [Nonlabens ulvanivorans]